MKAEVTRSGIKGKVIAPSSKSAMQRYIACALLSEGVSEINYSSLCEDSLAAISIAESLGADISFSGKKVIVKGGFKPRSSEISCGESGLSTRMFTPIAALHDKEIIITGTGSVLKRPVIMVERPLTDLGVKVSSDNGYLPLRIRGPLHGGNIIADGSVSSQFITGLLIALPAAFEDSKLSVNSLVSKPYIDLTLSILSEFRIKIENNRYQNFIIDGRQKFIGGSFDVEGDWSGAAFLMVMAAIAGDVVVEGINLKSAQADKAIIDALCLAGASVKTNADSVHIHKRELNGFEFDISDCPDLAPPLVVLACACKGKTIIKGADRLISKESNRRKTLEESISSIGGDIRNLKDRIEIEGGKQLSGGEADSFNDHRIAMTLVTAGLISSSPILIDGIECINKSYPGFIDDFISVGGKVKPM
jgi:3-phosphoshikimate 1-carboxyvinyltransferase